MASKSGKRKTGNTHVRGAAVGEVGQTTIGEGSFSAVSSEGVGRIDVRRIYNGEVKEIEFSFEIACEDVADSMGDIALDSVPEACGIIVRSATGRGGSEDLVRLDLTVRVDVTASCARCLCEIPDTLEYTQSYSLTKSTGFDDDEEYISVKNGMIDVYENARALFLLNVPTRFLCDEDCKGLCHKCGKNLNHGDCECNSDKSPEKKVDPRLAALLDIEID